MFYTKNTAERKMRKKNIYTYHGIPYGSVQERFVAAQPVQPWEGVLDTRSYLSYNHDLRLLALLKPDYDLN